LRAYCDTEKASPSACGSKTAGGASDLESLKSGKDITDKTLVCTQEKTNSGFPPRAEPPTDHVALSIFGTITLRRSLALLAYSSPT
jgi:hypothetical protein